MNSRSIAADSTARDDDLGDDDDACIRRRARPATPGRACWAPLRFEQPASGTKSAHTAAPLRLNRGPARRQKRSLFRLTREREPTDALDDDPLADFPSHSRTPTHSACRSRSEQRIGLADGLSSPPLSVRRSLSLSDDRGLDGGGRDTLLSGFRRDFPLPKRERERPLGPASRVRSEGDGF